MLDEKIMGLLEKKLNEVGEEAFFNKVKAAIIYTDNKEKKNRDKHFSIQKKVLYTSAGVSIANVIATLCSAWDCISAVIPFITAVSSIMSILVTMFMAEKANNKYSETWLRHQKHSADMEFEILEYVFESEKYKKINDKKDAAKKFEEEMLEVWKKNQSRFEVNMTHFEKE